MSDESRSERSVSADGGRRGGSVDYLDAEVNLLSPSTPFMRDHLKVVWATFLVWVLLVFGPVTATALAPDLMTGTTVLGFQLHFLLTAVGTPVGALVLSMVYAWRRDALDDRYGIDHAAAAEEGAPTAAADGGERR